MRLKVNWEHKRVKHAIERMWLRGISMKDVAVAIRRGQKKKQKKSGLIEAFYSYFSVVYDERFFNEHNIHKVYPVTVKMW
jgi:uncharacterized protein Veg